MEILKKVMQACLIALFVIVFVSPSLAQQAPPSPAAGSLEKGKTSSGPRKQLATIVFAGLGGMVLGLSTLSFYGRPQENLRNVAIGFAFGVMAGTAFVTYKAVTNPSELYGRQREIENTMLSATSSPEATPYGLNLAFEF